MITIIPHGLMTAYFYTKGTETEVRVLELSVIGFTFRLAVDEPADYKGVRLAAHMFDTGTDETIELKNYEITREADQKFWTEYRLETADEAYSKFIRRFMSMYARYSQLKLNQDYQGIEKEFLGQTISEESYCSSIEEQRKCWYKGLKMPEHIDEFEEIAVALSTPRLIARYFELPINAFMDEYYAQRGISDHPIAKKKVNCIYIGNQYCDILRPDVDTICGVIGKARKESLRPVICAAPVPERRIDNMKKVIEYLIDHECIDEVVVNDWGILSLLKSAQVTKTLGVLLCKRRKDPRMNRLHRGLGEEKETSLDSEAFRSYLSDHFGVLKYSYECTESFVYDADSAVLHWPMIQLNTSGTCVLRSACLHNDRAMQSNDDDCAKHCMNHYFFYPRELDTIGIYNSLFEFSRAGCGTKAKRLVIELP